MAMSIGQTAHFFSFSLKDHVMAFGWLSALKLIPWKSVLRNAPGVVNSARQLWMSVRSKNSIPTDPIVDIPDISSDPIGNLKIRVLQLEKERHEANVKALEAAALVKDLAEQQQQMVNAIGKLRLRSRIFMGATLVLTLLVLKILIWG